MAVHLEGTVWIPLVDLWETLFSTAEGEGIDLENRLVDQDSFRIDGDLIRFQSFPSCYRRASDAPEEARRNQELPASWFWSLAMNYLGVASWCECAFGPPRFESEDIVLDVVANSEGARSTNRWLKTLKPAWDAYDVRNKKAAEAQ